MLYSVRQQKMIVGVIRRGHPEKEESIEHGHMKAFMTFFENWTFKRSVDYERIRIREKDMSENAKFSLISIVNGS